jgi:diguanylate cyclase (GGDEF)-like protein
MISFLAFLDRKGMVQEIQWWDPPFGYPEEGTSFLKHLPSEERERFLRLLWDCQGRFCFTEPFSIQLAGKEEIMELRLVPSVDQVLVLGVDQKTFSPWVESKEFRILLTSMMEAVRIAAGKDRAVESDIVREQFEQIQALNNDLVNTARELEKANSQLSILSSELNNRLVKDPLTGLVSRYQYHSEIKMCLERFPDSLGIFVFIDLDDFKSINDQYGHRVGDLFLMEIGARLEGLRDDKIAMRISGDEFGLFFYGRKEVNTESFQFVWHLLETQVLHEPVFIKEGNVSIMPALSAGMAVYGQDTENVYELIDLADQAMYQAKKSGKNQYRVFRKLQHEKEK